MKVAFQEREVDQSNLLRSQLRMKNTFLCKKNVKQLNNTKQVVPPW